MTFDSFATRSVRLAARRTGDGLHECVHLEERNVPDFRFTVSCVDEDTTTPGLIMAHSNCAC
jgi:hypothetical protein